MSESALLAIDGAERVFGGGRTLFGGTLPAVHAVQDVTLEVRRGETLGVVGESGCGKSTLARMIVGLDRPSGGRITFDGEDLAEQAKSDPRALARRIQYVFQDPVSSLNPRKTVRSILEAPLIHLLGLDRAARAARLAELMEAENLAPEVLAR
jgi:peptide/nickel transport system ATP-binding protein